ncbi:MAG: hypothetical protein Q8Q46_00710 [Candidatus Giovannonibacteria bacterium]|nr:hypothetical protein [Candidatus Giovannonibacteria bacterium]
MAKKPISPDIKKRVERSVFFEIFHAAWGKDRGDGERSSDYNKEAWMYVQAKVELYFKKNK